MELNDIKEKLEEGLTNKDWEKLVEVIGDIEVEENEGEIKITLTWKKIPHILRILSELEPSQIFLDGKLLEKGVDFKYESLDHRIWIKTTKYSSGKYSIILK